MTYCAQGCIAGQEVWFVATHREANPSPVATYATVTVPLSMEDITTYLYVAAESAGADLSTFLDSEDDQYVRSVLLDTLLTASIGEFSEARDAIAAIRPRSSQKRGLNALRARVTRVFRNTTVTKPCRTAATEDVYYGHGRIGDQETRFVALYREANPSPVTTYATVTVPLSVDDIAAVLWALCEDGFDIADLDDQDFAHQVVLESLISCGIQEIAAAQEAIQDSRPGNADYPVITELRARVQALFDQAAPQAVTSARRELAGV